jgi:regulator of sigma E protease
VIGVDFLAGGGILQNPMIENTFKFVVISLEVLLLFNLLIIVHEFGHFLAAKWRGLVVEKFAVWFGKPLWKRTIGGVEYRLGWIPAGGFVAIPQLAPMEVLEGETANDREALPPAKPLDKIVVAAAGPAFSLGLAFVMAVIVWAVGKPEIEFDSTRVGMIVEGSAGEAAGFQVGDEILEVDGAPVKRFLSGTESVKWRVIRSEGETIPFLVRRDGRVMTIDAGWTKRETAGWRRPALREVGIGPRLPPGIGFVVRGGPGEQAGMQSGDLVITAGGVPVNDVRDLEPVIKANHGKDLPIEVLRDGQTVPLVLRVPVPPSGEAPVNLGIEWGRISFAHPAPWVQVGDAATSIFRMLGALFSTKSDVSAAHFSGPVGIMRIYYQVFESDYGWRLALSLSVLINVNLALLNLLPFPVLDGGHITLALIEAVRRKPINIRLLEVLQTACALLLIGFMLYVTFFDVGDFFAPGPDPPPPPTPAAEQSE